MIRRISEEAAAEAIREALGGMPHAVRERIEEHRLHHRLLEKVTRWQIGIAALLIIAAVLGGIAMAQPAPLVCAGSTAQKIACLQGGINREAVARADADASAAGKVADLLNADQRIIARLQELERRVTALEAAVGGSLPAPPPEPVPPPPQDAGPAVLAASFPSIADGRPVSQLGLMAWWYANLESPFIDEARQAFPGWRASGVSTTYADWWKAGAIDKATGWPKAMPSGASQIDLIFFRWGALFYPEKFAGDYVVDWQGDAEVRIGNGPAVRKIGANRIEATFTASNSFAWAEIARIGEGFRGIRIYRKEHEARLNAGEIFTPQWRAHVGRYKILRFMDVQAASEGRSWRKGDFAPEGFAFTPDHRTGAGTDMPRHPAPSLLFKAALAADAAAWVHVAGLPGGPASLNVQGADWRAAGREFRAVLASPDWAAYMDGLVAGMIAAGYPAERMVYLEPWNEVGWNWGGPWAAMAAYCWGIADELPIDQNTTVAPRYGFGYLAAHVMVEFDAALRRAGRKQAWALALGTQLAWPATTSASLDGFRAYFAERGQDAAPWLKHVGVNGGAYYLSEVFARDGSGYFAATTDAEHAAKWKAEISASPSGMAKKLADYAISGPKSVVGTIPFLVEKSKETQAIAEAAGAYYLGQYEGGAHMTLRHLSSEPAIAQWLNDWIIGPEGERVERAFIRALNAQNKDAVIANYYSIGLRMPDQPPWFDGFHGEQNGRTRGLEEMLR